MSASGGPVGPASPAGPASPDRPGGPGAALAAALARVRLVVLDVDGVLTDGTLRYGPDGEVEKTFHVRDGLGIRSLLRAGVEVAVVSGRGNDALLRRMTDLGVTRVVTLSRDKRAAVDALLADLSLSASEMACMGDDVLDLPMLEPAGVAIAVADAHPGVRSRVDWVTSAPGGRGAVREVADAICAARAAALDPGRSRGEPRFRVVIPARHGSSRLPGKPLRTLAGRPMIAHVWDRAAASGASEVIVATDDERIRDAVVGFGGRAVMTAADHASGTDRLAEVARREGWPARDIVVNLQGDEPAMDSALVTAVAAALAGHPGAGIATVATPIRTAAELFDPGVVKVVLDDAGLARYFSRAPIPWHRDGFGPDALAGAGAPTRLPDGAPYLRHLGLYAYRVGVLTRLAAEPARPCEAAEALEQLRALALGIDIHVTVAAEAPHRGVDTEADLERAERALARREEAP